MIITGDIYKVKMDKRLIAIRMGKHLEYFYLQNNLVKKFKRYLHSGRFISFMVSDDKKVYRGISARKVEYFIKIIRKSRVKQETYYDIDVIKSGIKDLINSLDNLMFLDLEMSMHDFDALPNFKSEIIQAGYIITNKEGKELETKSFYVKPSLFTKLTKRTKKFLDIDEQDLEKGLSYKEFYDKFRKSLEKYHPTILVWGKNDIIILKESYILNGMEDLNEKFNFINLLQIQKNYFNLKNDLGLFNALKIYSGEDYEQVHDALEDARVTKEVYFLFKKIINRKKEFVFPSL